MDRLAPKRPARWPAAWQRRLRDAEIDGGEVSQSHSQDNRTHHRPDHAPRSSGAPPDRTGQSGLMPANLTTFAHLSVSSDMNFPKSADAIGIGSAPKATSLPFMAGSARAALISWLSLSMIPAGVSL